MALCEIIFLRGVFPLLSQLHVLPYLLWVRYTEMYVHYSDFCYTKVLLCETSHDSLVVWAWYVIWAEKCRPCCFGSNLFRVIYTPYKSYKRK